jgi:hypothetical protein
MPAPAAVKAIVAGLLLSALVWSLLPQADRGLRRTDRAEVPSDFDSDRAVALIEERLRNPDGTEWMPAAGKAVPPGEGAVQQPGRHGWRKDGSD